MRARRDGSAPVARIKPRSSASASAPARAPDLVMPLPPAPERNFDEYATGSSTAAVFIPDEYERSSRFGPGTT